MVRLRTLLSHPHVLAVPMTPWAEEFMVQAAAVYHPHEACGIVIGGMAYSVTNRANNTLKFFTMDIEECVALVAAHGKPEALWHSHPGGNPMPSTADNEHHPAGYGLIIVADGKVYDYGIPASQ
jgi:proteasome lid subunit RPN8/RPN11